MNWLSIIQQILPVLSTVGVAVLGVLHVKNAQAIAGNVASLGNEAQMAAHGQWVQALPGIISDVASIAGSLKAGEVSAIGTPAGATLVHMSPANGLQAIQVGNSVATPTVSSSGPLGAAANLSAQASILNSAAQDLNAVTTIGNSAVRLARNL